MHHATQDKKQLSRDKFGGVLATALAIPTAITLLDRVSDDLRLTDLFWLTLRAWRSLTHAFWDWLIQLIRLPFQLSDLTKDALTLVVLLAGLALRAAVVAFLSRNGELSFLGFLGYQAKTSKWMGYLSMFAATAIAAVFFSPYLAGLDSLRAFWLWSLVIVVWLFVGFCFNARAAGDGPARANVVLHRAVGVIAGTLGLLFWLWFVGPIVRGEEQPQDVALWPFLGMVGFLSIALIYVFNPQSTVKVISVALGLYLADRAVAVLAFFVPTIDRWIETIELMR